MATGKPKKEQFSPTDFIDSIVNEGMSSISTDLNIIEFCEEILEIKTLHVPQKAVLKAFYGIPFDEDEQAWIDQMVAEDKCTWRPGVKYKEVALEVGMRSGKTLLASIVTVYEFWKLCNLDDPATHYGLIKGSPIYIITVATTQAQSNDTVFGYVCARMKNSSYFQSLLDKKKLYIESTRVEYPEKRLTIIGGHSNQAGMVGKTSKLFVMDEAARFKDTSTGESNAKSMYANVGRSTVTFGENGLKVIISSAWEEGDIMEWLYEVAHPEKPKQDVLAFRLATWDLNPPVSKEKLAREYEKDEIAARRDHEGIRPGTVENFFTKKAILNCIAERPSRITYNPIVITESERKYVGVLLNQIEVVDYPTYSYAHADPGLKKDSFGFACGRPVRTKDGIKIYIDVIIEWAPQDKGKGIVWPVNYDNVEDIIMKVHQARNIRRLTFDHWNSPGFIQRLYTKGIITRETPFSQGHQMSIYQIARQKFNTGMVVLPNDCPKAVRELVNIQLKNGRKIDHPPRNMDETPGSKDLADCIVAVIAQCADEERALTLAGRAESPIQALGKTHVADLSTPYGRSSINTGRLYKG